MKSIILKLVRFGIVGVVAAITYAVLAYVFIWVFEFSEVLASALAYLIAIPVSFIGQKYMTFMSKAAVKTEAGKFLILQLFCLVAAMLIPIIITDVVGLHPNFSILAVCILIPPISFGVMLFMIFTEKSKL